MSGVRAELAEAFRQINAAFNRLPVERRPEGIGEWGELDDEIDRAISAGDRTRALAAIEKFRAHQIARIEVAGR